MSNYQKLITFIDHEKLPWDYQELIELVGLEKTLEIAARIGGTYIYLEKIETVLMPAKRAMVLDQYSQGETNIRKLARDADLSMDTIYEILRKRNVIDGAGWKQEGLL